MQAKAYPCKNVQVKASLYKHVPVLKYTCQTIATIFICEFGYVPMKTKMLFTVFAL